jgi:phosphoribosylamine--glycine ligase
MDVQWSSDASACVILASRGYPAKYESGFVIAGLDAKGGHAGVDVFHSGTARSANGAWLTAGGRVLGITATGTTLPAALERCYDAAADIHWEGMQFRHDIGQFGQT